MRLRAAPASGRATQEARLTLVALHLHSTWSDGELTLAELRETFLARRVRAAFLTDHAEAFDAARLRDYRAMCAALSDREFHFVPGLEHGCEGRFHILAYGVTALLAESRPWAVLREIDARGGVGVVAHPLSERLEEIEAWPFAPRGIEVWNTKYDGRGGPRSETLALLDRMRRHDARVFAFYGTDLHWRRQYRGLLTEIEGEPETEQELVALLGAGLFHGVHAAGLLPSDGRLPPALSARLARARRSERKRRAWIERIRRLARALHLQMPPLLVRELRRFL